MTPEEKFDLWFAEWLPRADAAVAALVRRFACPSCKVMAGTHDIGDGYQYCDHCGAQLTKP